MLDLLHSGDNVLLVWISSLNAEAIKEFISKIKQVTGGTGIIAVENADQLVASQHPNSSFNVTFVNVIPPYTDVKAVKFGEILRILKPNGKLVVRSSSFEGLQSVLLLSGFVGISSPQKEELADGGINFEITANKPNYEIGSKVKISFEGKSMQSNNESSWKVSSKDDTMDLNDPDDLLTEDDLIRPDPSSLKVCGTTGKRKACKNCVCGLEEELNAEYEKSISNSKKNFTSSCGNCYLGDAFRCASCPYMGMPAFKPGEKVKLADSTLLDDI